MDNDEGKFDVFFGTRNELRSNPDLCELLDLGWYICGFNTLAETQNGDYIFAIAVAFDTTQPQGIEYDDDEEYIISADPQGRARLRTIQGYQNAFDFVNKSEGDGQIYMTPKRGERELPDA